MPIIQVKVRPRARKSALQRIADGTYVADLRAPPVDGKANAELIALLARHFDCPRSAVTIRSGVSSRMKLVQVDIGS